MTKVRARGAHAPRRLIIVACTAALAAALAAGEGCTPRVPVRRVSAPPARPETIVAALARREAATRGLRLSMTVRLSGSAPSADKSSADGTSASEGTPSADGTPSSDNRASPLLASPAYLAVDERGGIRLQVLSPFGMTVFDLTISGDAYRLTLPLKRQTVDGTIDLRALTDPAVTAADRMIVALALMFRPKARAEACRDGGPATVVCAVTPELAARITVDADLRPVREEYVRGDGTPVLHATFADYRGAEAATTPGSLVIEDAASGARMTIHVRRVLVRGQGLIRGQARFAGTRS